MGRRAMSPELQEARGNPGKRVKRKVGAVRRVATTAKIARPSWLTDALAKRVWDQLSGTLQFLKPSDVQVFGRYCIYLANWVEADREIAKTGGSVYETSSAHVENMMRINPWFTVRSRLEDDLIKIEEKIGLTPLDRMKIMTGLATAAGRPQGDLFGGAGDGAAGREADEAAPEVPAPADDMPTIGALSRALN